MYCIINENFGNFIEKDEFALLKKQYKKDYAEPWKLY